VLEEARILDEPDALDDGLDKQLPDGMPTERAASLRVMPLGYRRIPSARSSRCSLRKAEQTTAWSEVFVA
jgi:hypothetical protein